MVGVARIPAVNAKRFSQCVIPAGFWGLVTCVTLYPFQDWETSFDPEVRFGVVIGGYALPDRRAELVSP